MRKLVKFALAAAIAMPVVSTLPSCGTVVTDREQTYPEYSSRRAERKRVEALEGGGDKVLGDISIGGPDERGAGQFEGAAVNLYLWRAALETLSLGPLESADPFGGVIITDWFTLDEDPENQYRVTAYILGRQLRTDNIRVALYLRSVENGNARTRRASTAAERRLEDVILSKARTIRATQYK